MSGIDYVKLEIPAYPKIVKKPMDLSTIKKKLEAGIYTTAEQFHDDFKLMISNCMKFNPINTPVNICGQELNRLFYEKWKNLPQPRSAVESDEAQWGMEGYENTHKLNEVFERFLKRTSEEATQCIRYDSLYQPTPKPKKN